MTKDCISYIEKYIEIDGLKLKYYKGKIFKTEQYDVTKGSIVTKKYLYKYKPAGWFRTFGIHCNQKDKTGESLNENEFLILKKEQQNPELKIDGLLFIHHINDIKTNPFTCHFISVEDYVKYQVPYDNQASGNMLTYCVGKSYFKEIKMSFLSKYRTVIEENKMVV